jgi:hypothetical protein
MRGSMNVKFSRIIVGLGRELETRQQTKQRNSFLTGTDYLLQENQKNLGNTYFSVQMIPRYFAPG